MRNDFLLLSLYIATQKLLQGKRAIIILYHLSAGMKRFGELTNINVELLFRDLFVLRDRFRELGMVIKNGEVYLPDLEERDV